MPKRRIAPAIRSVDRAEKNDPAAFAKVEAEARSSQRQGTAVEAGEAGRETVLSVRHLMTDGHASPRCRPPRRKRYDSAGTIVIETTDAMDKAKMMAAMASEPGLDDVHRQHHADRRCCRRTMRRR
ncbi:hypothetical protein ACVOMV_05485 [Mesorhizobium atlanticum]